jgi:hypothetical protein
MDIVTDYEYYEVPKTLMYQIEFYGTGPAWIGCAC